jgi:predicted DNA-binding transcriptional regulator AlpA
MHFLTTKEVCILLHIHQNTLYNWCKSGKFIQPVKPSGKNGKNLWLLSNVEEFIKESNN